MDQQARPKVALPETRQLDLLAELLERRGLDVLRCPLVAIKDSPHPADVRAWLERFSAGAMDLLVVYTGEGIHRLLAAAEKAGRRAAFVEALATTPLLTRGPKPVRALRQLGVKPTYPAKAPTTDGVLATLADLDLAARRVGVQLYGAEPLPALMQYLEDRGATADCVAPYVYASESDDAAVVALIEQLAAGRIAAIAFTSKAQVERLAALAERAGLKAALQQGLKSAVVAAVGPVAAAELRAFGVAVDVMPESDYFMKPMVTALMTRLEEGEEEGVGKGVRALPSEDGPLRSEEGL